MIIRSLFEQFEVSSLISVIVPILINKISLEITISKFINQRLEFMVDYYCLDLNILSNKKKVIKEIKTFLVIKVPIESSILFINLNID